MRAIGLLVVATSIVPILAGLVVFHDPLPASAVPLTLRLGGFALVLAGGALLATRVMMGAGEEASPASVPVASPAPRGA